MHRIAILALVVACHAKSDGASCGAAAGNFLVLAKADLALAKPTGETSRDVLDQLPAMRDALAAACTDGDWPAAVRDCLATATDHERFQTCEQALTPAQRKSLAGSGR